MGRGRRTYDGTAVVSVSLFRGATVPVSEPALDHSEFNKAHVNACPLRALSKARGKGTLLRQSLGNGSAQSSISRNTRYSPFLGYDPKQCHQDDWHHDGRHQPRHHPIACRHCGLLHPSGGFWLSVTRQRRCAVYQDGAASERRPRPHVSRPGSGGPDFASGATRKKSDFVQVRQDRARRLSKIAQFPRSTARLSCLQTRTGLHTGSAAGQRRRPTAVGDGPSANP